MDTQMPGRMAGVWLVESLSVKPDVSDLSQSFFSPRVSVFLQPQQRILLDGLETN